MSTAAVAAVRINADAGVDWFALIVLLPGGLALFLYGMKMLGVHIKAAAGAKLQQLMLRLSASRVLGFFAGVVVTAMTSSLSLVSVLLVQVRSFFWWFVYMTEYLTILMK